MHLNNSFGLLRFIKNKELNLYGKCYFYQSTHTNHMIHPTSQPLGSYCASRKFGQICRKYSVDCSSYNLLYENS